MGRGACREIKEIKEVKEVKEIGFGGYFSLISLNSLNSLSSLYSLILPKFSKFPKFPKKKYLWRYLSKSSSYFASWNKTINLKPLLLWSLIILSIVATVAHIQSTASPVTTSQWAMRSLLARCTSIQSAPCVVPRAAIVSTPQRLISAHRCTSHARHNRCNIAYTYSYINKN